MQPLMFCCRRTGREIQSGIAQHLPAPLAEPFPTVGPGAKPQPCTDGVGIGPLVFRCPTTGHTVESGIEMDLQTFRQVGHLGVRLRCRSCGRPHQLKVTEGCLASYRMPPGVGDLYRNQGPPAKDTASEQKKPDREAAQETPLDVRGRPDVSVKAHTFH